MPTRRVRALRTTGLTSVPDVKPRGRVVDGDNSTHALITCDERSRYASFALFPVIRSLVVATSTYAGVQELDQGIAGLEFRRLHDSDSLQYGASRGRMRNGCELRERYGLGPNPKR